MDCMNNSKKEEVVRYVKRNSREFNMDKIKEL